LKGGNNSREETIHGNTVLEKKLALIESKKLQVLVIFDL
jgi:hypothetical protein